MLLQGLTDIFCAVRRAAISERHLGRQSLVGPLPSAATCEVQEIVIFQYTRHARVQRGTIICW